MEEKNLGSKINIEEKKEKILQFNKFHVLRTLIKL